MSASTLPASAHAADAVTKSPSPAANMRRRPNRSPSAAAVISSTAKLKLYALTVHSRSSIEEPRSSRMVCSAVDTTGVSSAAIREATEARARTRALAAATGSCGGADPALTFRRRAGRLLSACGEQGPGDRLIAVADCPLSADLMARTGALEITVHGWDVAQACGHPRPIPPPLAAGLLPVGRLLVTEAERRIAFAPAIALPSSACPGDRLVAFLGRDPRACSPAG
ncbi:hypothetical protein NLX86_16950 [Streptomyces sp. A3M-1-3]|nr:hypothetical protein [Streptomyces sp. A3M-1-3]